ncbi:MAG: hypothetical protein KDD35_09835, partial [Bdellovibrionales bacterium]|nr:hypothetical protein [Bdellovibrionales bacterium]
MNKGQNNLFFCTLGNLVGFVFFLLFLQDLSINVKLICATGWTVFSSFVSKGWYLRFFSSMLFIFSFFPFGLSDLDKRIVSRGLYIFRSGQNPEYLSNSSNEQENQLTRFDSFHRKMGQLGYLENPKLAPRKYLGLNGYQDQILKPNDILRSVVVADLLENDTKKILILGMGNQLLLTRIKSLIYRSQRKDLQIDLVDNFPPFLDIEFLNAIAREGGFQWPQDQFNFIYADALNFLSRVEPESYDMIVWNLTSPNFGTSAKIFTRQMSQLVARAIRSKGIYLTKTFGNLSLDCSLVDGFQQSFHYPLNSCRSTSFQLAYGKKNQPDSLGNAPILEASFTKLFFSPLLNTSSSLECSSVPKLTLANSNMRPILKKLGTITRDRECYTSKIPDWDFGDNLNRSTRLALTLEKAAIPIVFSLPIDLPNQDMEKRLTRSTELWMEMTGTTKFLPLYLSEYSSHYFAI